MILIADSGATTTEWRLIGDSKNYTIRTEGLNPYYHTNASIIEVLKKNLIPKLSPLSISDIYFYGAGCDSQTKEDEVKKAIAACFDDINIQIYHDLLASARACCMHDPGIACIMGTGSNSCQYDGENITHHMPSLAFVLGDEGSAGYFGKKLINAYFRKEMPDELAAALEHGYNMDLDYIMDQVSENPQLSRFVASYAAFLSDRPEHPFIDTLLREGFENFITRIVKKYPGASALEISFIGTVAFVHQEMIKELLNENNMKTGRFIRSPMERLVEFHTT